MMWALQSFEILLCVAKVNVIPARNRPHWLEARLLFDIFCK